MTIVPRATGPGHDRVRGRIRCPIRSSGRRQPHLHRL